MARLSKREMRGVLARVVFLFQALVGTTFLKCFGMSVSGRRKATPVAHLQPWRRR